ncbi:hypothetical protein J6590_072270 [Homalodisca vitripennis]|nr:hypothetical protein J6590_072270 [Homalodisca vitripennis]
MSSKTFSISYYLSRNNNRVKVKTIDTECLLSQEKVYSFHGFPTEIHITSVSRLKTRIFQSGVLVGFDDGYIRNRVTEKYSKFLDVCNTMERFYRSLQLAPPACGMTVKQDGTSSTKMKSYMSAYQMLRGAVDQANAFYCDLLIGSVFYKFLHLTISLYAFFLFLMPICLLDLIRSGMLVVSLNTDVIQAVDDTAPMICKLINEDLDDN